MLLAFAFLVISMCSIIAIGRMLYMIAWRAM